MKLESGKPDYKKLFERAARIARYQAAFILVLLLGGLFFTQPASWLQEWWDTYAIHPVLDSPEQAAAAPPPEVAYWQAPDIGEEKDSLTRETLQYGKELVINTSHYFGPHGIVEANRTNGLNCQNCHLEAGTKIFGNNYSRVAATYPKLRARSGQVEDVYKRINDCFERSLNGTALDTSSEEMRAMAAYILYLGKDVPKGEKPLGSGFKDLPLLNRAADPTKGRLVYEEQCQSCHQADGQGVAAGTPDMAYAPPLWGELSYNDGAGLYRMSNFAKYVKWNMPNGASHDNEVLSDEEAWDVAAFVNSQPRPSKDLSADWPDISKKPFDHPFGPYADDFSELEHKYGPFGPIKQFIESSSNSQP